MSETNSRKEKISKTSSYRSVSEETKDKISKSRIKYLNENPDKIPYLLNHSSKQSWPEKRFQKILENNNINGWIYNYSVSRYCLDFAFPEWKIDVEIDGETHQLDNVKKIDQKRKIFLENLNWTIIRFTAKEINDDPFTCIQKIINYLNIDKIIEIPLEFLQYKKEKEILKALKNNQCGEKPKHMTNKRFENSKKYIELINNSSIDFSKFGWVQKVSDLTGIRTQKINKFMKDFMFNFYSEKCFKHK